MSATTDNDVDRPDAEADKRADAMKDQLRKDVASWSSARSAGSVREAAEFSVPVAKQAAAPPARRARKPRPVTPAVNPASVKKPFSMAYDGVTAADYITYMIARGAR